MLRKEGVGARVVRKKIANDFHDEKMIHRFSFYYYYHTSRIFSLSNLLFFSVCLTASTCFISNQGFKLNPFPSFLSLSQLPPSPP